MGGNKLASLLLRIGLSIVLIYAALSSLIHPQDWVGYLPHFLTNNFSGTMLLRGFSVFELALATWLLSGRYVKYAAGAAVLMFSGIIVSNPGQFIVTFRDVALIFMSLALIFIKD